MESTGSVHRNRQNASPKSPKAMVRFPYPEGRP